jgi:hypothetical protein
MKKLRYVLVVITLKCEERFEEISNLKKMNNKCLQEDQHNNF